MRGEKRINKIEEVGMSFYIQMKCVSRKERKEDAKGAKKLTYKSMEEIL